MAEPNGFMLGSNGEVIELVDAKARAELIKIPEVFKTALSGTVGQIFEVAETDEAGNVTAIRAVDKPAGSASGGMSADAAELLIDLMSNALYPEDYDAAAKIAALKEALGTGAADVTQSGSTLTISGIQNIATITQSGPVLTMT